MPWYESRQNLLELATWLLENDVDFTVLDVMDFLSGPWRWDHQWHEYLAATNGILGAIV